MSTNIDIATTGSELLPEFEMLRHDASNADIVQALNELRKTQADIVVLLNTIKGQVEPALNSISNSMIGSMLGMKG